MSDDKKPRITSFAFSKEIFSDPSFSSFLFDNNDLMNIDLDKKSESPNLKSPTLRSEKSPKLSSPRLNSPKLKSQNQYYSKESQSHPLSATVYNTSKDYNTMNSQKSYNSKYSTSNSYHINSPISAPVENYSSYKQSTTSNETNETTSYYNIINAIKRENINNINSTSKSLHSANSSLSNPSTPPLSPPAVNINNQMFYKGATQQSHSAVDLSRPDPYYDEIKGSKSVKDYSNSPSSSYTKPRSRSIHNINSNSNTYEDDSFDYLNDSMTEYSFTQKDYEPSVATNGSEKKGHSRSLSKSLKRAVSRGSKKSKKGHRKNASVSEKSNKGFNDNVSYSSSIKQNDYNGMSQYQEFNDASLVFKPSNGAISSYGDLNNDNSFDFDSLISSDQTRKISLTPNRMNEIQNHNVPINRLKPKSHERENLVPMTVINGTIGRNKGKSNYNNNMGMNMMMDDYDSDDSIDRLLNDGKPKKKQETLWEFLKNSDPEDFMGNGKNKQAGKKVQSPQTRSNSQGSQAKYIPIKIQYSPFDNINNGTSTTGTNTTNNSMNKPKVTNIPKKPMNENVMKLGPKNVNANLPIQQRGSSKGNIKVPAPPPHGGSLSHGPAPPPHGISKSLSPNVSTGTSQAMKLAQTISLLAKTPELSSNDEEPQTPQTPQTPIQPPTSQIHEKQYKSYEKPKPKMVSTGTQYYLSDAPLVRKKKVLFRPVDRRNPIAKYMFNHAFVETIYVSINDSLKRRRNASVVVPVDFLARNFYYYGRYPSAVPQMPKKLQLNWTYPKRDDNPIAKYMFLVKEGEYPWRDTNPVAKYIFNGWDKKNTSSYVINSEYLPEINEIDFTENADKEIEIINDVLIETASSCGGEEIHMEKNEEVIKIENDADNEDKTEINEEANMSNIVKKNEIEKELRGIYTQKEKDEIVNKLFGKIIHYLEEKEEKQKENNKTQEFAKLMFDENTKLHKELSKLRSELSAERVLRERAEEELDRYQTLMHSTLLK